MIITAEIGSHWQGNFLLLDNMINHLKKAGFDYVKFQAISKERLDRHPELLYYPESSINKKNIAIVDSICKNHKMPWYCTPTEASQIEYLDPYVNMYKISARDLDNDKLKDAVFSTGKKVIISSEKPFKTNSANIINLYVIPKYPTPYNQINFDLLASFDGFSCHTPTFRAVLMAASMGIKYLEIHIMPNNEEFYLDSKVSFSITECYELLSYVRILEDWNNNRSKVDIKQIPPKNSKWV